MILLEALPPEVGKIVAERAEIPIIGIGAGPHVDGQCLVVYDMLGMFELFMPKLVKKYSAIGQQIVQAMNAFREDVQTGGFPAPEHCCGMPEAEIQKLNEFLKQSR